MCNGTGSACTADCIFALRKFHRTGSQPADPWFVFNSAQWNVKYFQWSSAGNRTAEDSGDYGSNRTGCGYCGSGSVAVYYKPWSLCTADRNGDLFCGCMCIKRQGDEEVFAV